ncbi:MULTISPECIES: CvpA family protein [unclassified Myroides]|uniref:CvpA family protein n=1 Tax=unclassified Myroides TaxID=2642485 RepID=UPI0015F96D5C|nr:MULTISPECIES: CvpA family protein [unclassified Myroides]MBB1150949.1 CvpA family protein [Myroides sp. NP-2]MDM1406839.1 CvpA family protein [Myroides sp. DF42-4-2]
MLLDILVVLALAFGVFKGVQKGFFVSVVAFLSLLIGTIGALKFSNVVKDFLQQQWGWESSFLPVFSFVIAFILAILVVRLAAQIATKVFEAAFLGLFNRLLGAIFQLFVVILVMSLLYALVDQINSFFILVSPETLNQAKSYQIYLFVSEHIFPSLFQMVAYLFEKSVDVLQTPTPESI